ncbi:MAG: Ig-like domain-containing protein [Nevskia sp.]|nr:Ig-like domain-containing protein [Nevskia sp.]
MPTAASTVASGVTLTAFCKDSSNNLKSGVTVNFKTTGGAISVTQGTTDASGEAIAVLTTFGEPINRSVTVTASSGSASASLPITEAGTTVQVTGVNVVSSGAKVTYTVKLTDSSANGISNATVSLASALNNAITPASATTDANGQATFSYTGTNGGTDTLTATSTALNASGSYSINVSSSSLTFTLPATNATSIPFNTPTTVQIQYVVAGAPVTGAVVKFSTTRGVISGGNTNSDTSTTDATGLASVTIDATGTDGAGGAIVTASVTGGGPSVSLPLQFLANSPTAVSIQASPSTIAPSATSAVTATVRDASNNLVQGQVVNFTLVDTTGGSLSAQSAITDQSGNASVTYQATSTSSSQGGVKVTASFVSNGTTYTTPTAAKITVGGQALRITLGTSNKLLVLDETRYQMPYSVVVTDSAGNPVPGATFRLSIQAVAYQKGFQQFFGSAWAPDIDSLVQKSDSHFNTPPTGSTGFNILFELPFGCLTEDPTNAGIYSKALDYNGNGVLDPGEPASVPSSVALDATGSAQFLITYAKDHAQWTEVLLTGTASVAGTETVATAEFVLPVLAADVNQKDVAPPGQISPYGDGANEPPTYDSFGNRIVVPNTCAAPN